jgi:hypothetical protein
MLKQDGRNVIRREIQIKNIIESVDVNNGQEWQPKLVGDTEDTRLNMGFRMGRPADEEMGGAI